MTNITDSLRYAEDQCNAVDCIVSQDQKQVYLVQVANDQVGFADTSTNRVMISKRITIADGYRAWTVSQVSPYDGFLYPRVQQLDSRTAVQSGGQLGRMNVLIGAIVFPYCFNGISGGLDPAIFQPLIGNNNNIQTYIQILGLGLPTNQSYFDIKEVMLTGKSIQEGISYKILAEYNGLSIG